MFRRMGMLRQWVRWMRHSGVVSGHGMRSGVQRDIQRSTCPLAEINILPTQGKMERQPGMCPVSAIERIDFQPSEKDLGVEGYELEVSDKEH